MTNGTMCVKKITHVFLSMTSSWSNDQKLTPMTTWFHIPSPKRATISLNICCKLWSVLPTFYKQLFHQFHIIKNKILNWKYIKAEEISIVHKSYLYNVGKINTCSQFHKKFTNNFWDTLLLPRITDPNCK